MSFVPICRRRLKTEHLAPVESCVVEGRYSGLFKTEHVSGAWLAKMLARLQVRYPEVQVVFADSRKFAEEWTYRFLGAALGDSNPARDPTLPRPSTPSAPRWP